MIHHKDSNFPYIPDIYLIGVRIRHFRELRNYTQEYVASELGLSQNSYSRLERDPGRISLLRLIRILSVLQISFEDLFETGNNYNLSR